MTKTHVVCKSVDCPTLDRAESGREEHGIATGVFLEKKELRVIGERCAVIQIDFCNGSEISTIEPKESIGTVKTDFAVWNGSL
jgi:hypothetical protein